MFIAIRRFQYAFVQNLVDLDKDSSALRTTWTQVTRIGKLSWPSQPFGTGWSYQIHDTDVTTCQVRVSRRWLGPQSAYGYRKLSKEEAKSGNFNQPGLREVRVPEATPILHEIRRRLMETQIPTVVVDWLNEQGIQPEPTVENGRSGEVQISKEVVLRPEAARHTVVGAVVRTQIFGTGGFKHQAKPRA